MEKRAVAVIVRDGKILLMHRVRDGEEYFVFPGGGVKEGETVEEAVIREVKEEFGLDARVNRQLFEMENKGRREFYFLVTEFSGTPRVGGEEKARSGPDNRYAPVWKDVQGLADLADLYPEEARRRISQLL